MFLEILQNSQENTCQTTASGYSFLWDQKIWVSEVLGCCTVNIILHMIHKISHANITYSLVAFLVNYSSFGDHVWCHIVYACHLFPLKQKCFHLIRRFWYPNIVHVEISTKVENSVGYLNVDWLYTHSIFFVTHVIRRGETCPELIPWDSMNKSTLPWKK